MMPVYTFVFGLPARIARSQNRVRQNFFHRSCNGCRDSVRPFADGRHACELNQLLFFRRRVSILARISLGTAVLTGFNHVPHSSEGSMHCESAVSDTMTMPIFCHAAKVSAIFQSKAAWENPGSARAPQ